MTIHTQLAELLSYIDSQAEPRIVFDKDYTIIAANKAYRATYGDNRSLVGRHCYEVSHHYTRPCDQAGEACPLKSATQTGNPQRVLHIHHTPRGEEHIDVELSPIRNANDEIVYYVEMMRTVRQASTRPDKRGLVGRSSEFNKMLGLIERVATSDAAVVLLGESGTGKELVAQAIHDSSHRKLGPFVPVDCSGVTDTLFESELFGYEKGAFTGANQRKQGLVESASGGTLFLDEIGDIPLSLQVKLLRLLESGTYRRVGGIEPLRADFRLVSATHRDLKSMVMQDTFRKDLYYRISTFPIHLPSLVERREDIPLLAETLLARIRTDRPFKLSQDSLNLLASCDFPGNIRELRNILERASLLADGDTILPEHLDTELAAKADSTSATFIGQEIIPLDTLEQHYLQWALAHFGTDKKTLALKLGISERTLYRKIQS
ncbi:sigma-54 interaction domain-containing protein [Sulfuriferula nivalis]|uniref:Transcriptional regulator n=1 Tax=Sulfuriferula nivalis TaxID=2675298 RepID=A0A809RHX6_9PROT|nr:sigma-54-dependent Fis family transcriptional regulator [Sulfuriferula nivalis]BBP01499.1 transcriptional regulator [Sulfuriferula nivalis]